MSKPWLLLAAGAFSTGALLGWSGAVLAGVVTLVANAAARQRPWLALAIVVAFAMLGTLRAGFWEPPPFPAGLQDSQRVEGVVRDIPEMGPSGPRSVVRVQRLEDDDGEWRSEQGDILVFFGDSASAGVLRGDTVRLRWSVEPLATTEPGFSSFVASNDASGYGWSYSTTILERGRSPQNHLVRLRGVLTSRIQEVIAGDAGALIAGFVTGDDSGLSEEAQASFALTNTSHITAVSGANVAVLISIWATAVPGRRTKRSLLMQLGLLTLVWSYVVLVGFGAPAVRAGLFASLALPAARLGRKADPLTMLMLASAIMLAVEPALSLNIGFWLSMAATTAMVMTLAPVEGMLRTGVARAIMALAAAQLATFPILLVVFGSWSPSSIIANFVIGPMVALVFPIAFGLALLLALQPWLANIVSWIPELVANMILAVVDTLAGEMPMIRPGPVSTPFVVLIAIFCLAIIASMSADVRRWFQRVGYANAGHASILVALGCGACGGVWTATVVLLPIFRG